MSGIFAARNNVYAPIRQFQLDIVHPSSILACTVKLAEVTSDSKQGGGSHMTRVNPNEGKTLPSFHNTHSSDTCVGYSYLY